MQEEDQILLEELQSGHKAAHELVIKKYYRALALKVFLILDDEMEAEDLVQNLFVEMWQKNHYQSVKSSLKAYLFRAVPSNGKTGMEIAPRCFYMERKVM